MKFENISRKFKNFTPNKINQAQHHICGYWVTVNGAYVDKTEIVAANGNDRVGPMTPIEIIIISIFSNHKYLNKKYLFRHFLPLLCIINYHSYCQNLIPNPSFEEYWDSKIEDAHTGPQFEYQTYISRLYSWKANSWQVFYYNIKHFHKNQESQDNFYTCEPICHNIPDGNACIKFLYEWNDPQNDKNIIRSSQSYGMTAYLTCKLKEELTIGKTYEISMFVYLPNHEFLDPKFRTHIGFTLTLEEPNQIINSMLSVPYFFSDTIELDKWFRITKRVKATCNLKYLTIGMFESMFFPSQTPTQYHNTNSSFPKYYVDNLSLIEIKDSTYDNESEIIDFCKYKEKISLKNNSSNEIKIRFTTNDTSIQIKYQNQIDSLLKTINLSSNVIIIEGNADVIGTKESNLQLSYNRAIAIKNYIKQFQLKNKILCFGNGELINSKIATIKVVNQIEAGYLYKHLTNESLTVMSKNEANNLCIELLNSISSHELFYLYHDSLFMSRQENKTILNGKLATIFNNSRWPQLRIIDSLYAVDQIIRSGTFLSNISQTISSKFRLNYPEQLADYDKRISNELFKLISPTKFPKIKDIGMYNLHKLMTLLIHSPDTNKVKPFLELIYNNCMIGEANWLDYATLKDKYLVNGSKDQMYGTQYSIDKNTNEMILTSADKIDSINLNRKSIGLNPILTINTGIYLKQK